MPINGVSPAEALMSRRLRAVLPISHKQLEPQVISAEEFHRKRRETHDKQKWYHDKTAKSLPPLREGDSVRVKLDPKSPWKPAVVLEKHATPRSYIIRTKDGGEYRRNRRHLMKTLEPPNLYQQEEEDIPPNLYQQEEEDIPIPGTVLQPTTPTAPATEVLNPTLGSCPPQLNEPQGNSSNVRVSRYGRVIRPNPRYKDWVLVNWHCLI